MGVLQKLICKKVKCDDYFLAEPQWGKQQPPVGTASTEDDSPSSSSSSAVAVAAQHQQQKGRDGDDPSVEWIMNYRIVGLQGTVAMQDSDRYIVQQVLKCLSNNNVKKSKPKPKKKKQPDSQLVVASHVQPSTKSILRNKATVDSQETLTRPLPKSGRRQRRQIRMAETKLQTMGQAKHELGVEPVSASTRSRVSFAEDLERHIVPPSQVVSRSTSSPRYYFSPSSLELSSVKKGGNSAFLSDEKRLEEEEEQSTGDDSSVDSVETLELLFHHMTCSPQNRLSARDWIR